MGKKKRLLVILVSAMLLSVVSLTIVLLRKSPGKVKPTEAVNPEQEIAFTGLEFAQQKKIWDVEHYTFEFETHFAKTLAELWKSRQQERLLGFFNPELKSSLQLENGENRHVDDISSNMRIRANGEDKSGAVELTQAMVEWLGSFERVHKTSMRVLKMRGDPELGWTVQALLSATGVAANGTQLEHYSHHELTCRFSSDKEIQQPSMLQSWVVKDVTDRASPGFLMEEVTQQFGLDRAPIRDNWSLQEQSLEQYHFQLAVADFEQDGFLDIAIATDKGKPILLRSEDGIRFVNATEGSGLTEWDPKSESFLATVIDFDNDSYPDLLLGNRLFRNQQGRGLEDWTANSGLSINRSPSGCVVADYDADGFLDLYFLYTSGERDRDKAIPWVGDDQSGAENSLWRNTGKGSFQNVTTETKAGGGRRHTFAAAWLYLGEDHFPDLYIANDFGENVLLENTGDGVFRDVTSESQTGDFATSMGVAAGDIDNDGDTDLYVANMYSKMGRRIIDHVSESDYPPDVYKGILGACAGNRLYRNNGDDSFGDLSLFAGVNSVGWAHAPCIVDINGDGWLDLYSTAGFSSRDRRKPDG
ncbi:MAG: VCBS repeat-containing protein [Planctomycetota bacterium]